MTNVLTGWALGAYDHLVETGDLLARNSGNQFGVAAVNFNGPVTWSDGPPQYGTAGGVAIISVGGTCQRYWDMLRRGQVQLLVDYDRTPPSPNWPGPGAGTQTAGTILQLPMDECSSLHFYGAAKFA